MGRNLSNMDQQLRKKYFMTKTRNDHEKTLFDRKCQNLDRQTVSMLEGHLTDFKKTSEAMRRFHTTSGWSKDAVPPSNADFKGTLIDLRSQTAPWSYFGSGCIEMWEKIPGRFTRSSRDGIRPHTAGVTGDRKPQGVPGRDLTRPVTAAPSSSLHVTHRVNTDTPRPATSGVTSRGKTGTGKQTVSGRRQMALSEHRHKGPSGVCLVSDRSLLNDLKPHNEKSQSPPAEEPELEKRKPSNQLFKEIDKVSFSDAAPSLPVKKDTCIEFVHKDDEVDKKSRKISLFETSSPLEHVQNDEIKNFEEAFDKSDESDSLNETREENLQKTPEVNVENQQRTLKVKSQGQSNPGIIKSKSRKSTNSQVSQLPSLTKTVELQDSKLEEQLSQGQTDLPVVSSIGEDKDTSYHDLIKEADADFVVSRPTYDSSRFYVRPQERYKQEKMFLMKRYFLLQRQMNDTDTYAINAAKSKMKINIVFSQLARRRALRKLVDENTAHVKSVSKQEADKNIQEKVDRFLDSIEKFIKENQDEINNNEQIRETKVEPPIK